MQADPGSDASALVAAEAHALSKEMLAGHLAERRMRVIEHAVSSAGTALIIVVMVVCLTRVYLETRRYAIIERMQEAKCMVDGKLGRKVVDE